MPMDPVHFSLDKETHLAFWRMQFDASLKRGLLILGALIVALAGLAFMFDDGASMIAIIIGGTVGVVVVLTLVRFVFLPRNAAKMWREYALIKEPMELTMSEAEFSLNQPSAHVRAQWAQMVKWNENDVLLAIYLNAQMAYVLPKEAIGKEHIDYARERLIASGLATRGKGRK